MPDSESLSEAESGGIVAPLNRSLFAVCCILGFCVLLCVVSTVSFVFQYQERDEYGELLRDEPAVWAHLVGYVLRGVFSAALAWCLWRYLLAVHRIKTNDHHEFHKVFQSLACWWYVLATSVVLIVIYQAFFSYEIGLGVASRPLSPRFRFDPSDQSRAQVEFRLAETDRVDGLIEANVEGSSETIFLHKEPFVTNKDISAARVVLNDDDEPVVDVTFAKAAHQKIRAATSAHRGRPLAILIDGKVVNAPIVQWQIGERALIDGSFSRDEAERIARGLVGK